MDAQIKQAIRYLARVTGNRFPADLYADLYQQAALRLIESGATDDRTMFRVAYRGAAQEYQRYYRYRRGQLMLAQLRRAGHSEGGLSPDVAAQLAELLLKCRAKRGERGKRAAWRDVQICDFLSRGYSDDGIALEMGLSYTSVREYRKRLKEKLRQLTVGNFSDTILVVVAERDA